MRGGSIVRERPWSKKRMRDKDNKKDSVIGSTD